ncbi:unnamed protein product [Ectocarpus sp. 4 AP-2014]
MGFPEYGACKWPGKGLPVLEMNGAEYTQSTALLRYAGKLGGLYPEDALAALKADVIVMIGEDVMANVFKCMGENDDTVTKGVLEGKVKGLVELLVSKLAANPSSKFFVGTSPTIADVQVRRPLAQTLRNTNRNSCPRLVVPIGYPTASLPYPETTMSHPACVCF